MFLLSLFRRRPAKPNVKVLEAFELLVWEITRRENEARKEGRA